ncbi:MAG: hypothetical protein HOV81_35090 [Kofleriaceae bacterium]|nr:hypothetical protein [Kofleriaceae bacterium]
MTTPKSRPINEGGTTADSRQAPEPAGKPTSSPEYRGEKPKVEDERDGQGKQTIESSRREASLGQRPTRDDGDNDNEGELK